MVMSLENEMKLEMRRLENEIAVIDAQLDKINHHQAELVKIRQKKEHDLKALRFNFYPEEAVETKRQSTLLGHMKG